MELIIAILIQLGIISNAGQFNFEDFDKWQNDKARMELDESIIEKIIVIDQDEH